MMSNFVFSLALQNQHRMLIGLRLIVLNQKYAYCLPSNLNPKIHLPLRKKRIQYPVNPLQRLPAPTHHKIKIHIRRQTRQQAASGIPDLHARVYPDQTKAWHFLDA